MQQLVSERLFGVFPDGTVGFGETGVPHFVIGGTIRNQQRELHVQFQKVQFPFQVVLVPVMDKTDRGIHIPFHNLYLPFGINGGHRSRIGLYIVVKGFRDMAVRPGKAETLDKHGHVLADISPVKETNIVFT